MTKAEITFIIETTLGEALNAVTPLLSVKSLKISKLENKLPKINRLRLKFDMSNEIIECYVCRKYDGEIPSNWTVGKNYDIYDGITYKYLFNNDTMEPYVDIFDFSDIVMIEL